MKDKIVNNKQLIMIIASIVFVGIGTTFAWFTWRSTDNTNLVVNIGSIAEVIYTEGNDITASNIGPVLDYNDGEITTFSFSNRASNKELTAYIYITPTTLPETLKHESFKVKLLKSSDNITFTEVVTEDFTNKTVNTEFLLAEDLANPGKTYYKLIIYIDGHILNPNEMMGQTFAATIRVDADLTAKPDLIVSSNIGSFSHGLYTATMNCDNAEATYISKNKQFLIKNLTNITTNCEAIYVEDDTDYLTLYETIKELYMNTQEGGPVYRENHDYNSDGTYDYYEYRYEGPSTEINNYVWFNNELWRIIGAFPGGTPSTVDGDGTFVQGDAAPSTENTVKIIRNDSIGAFAWDKDSTNNWSTAELNTNILNNLYLNSSSGTCNFFAHAGTKPCSFENNGLKDVQEYLAEATWNLGGLALDWVDLPETILTYQKERETSVYGSNPYLTTAKVGLMYPSDYGYSTSSDDCQTETYLSEYASCAQDGWLLKYGNEWTQTHEISMGKSAIINISSTASVDFGSSQYGHVVRPVVHLKSNVYVTEGTGSIDNPYQIRIGG